MDSYKGGYDYRGELSMHQNQRFSRRNFLSLSLATVGAASAGALLGTKPALGQETRTASYIFTDDLGRNIRVPNIIESVTPTGIHAQTILTELYPQKMASLAMEISESDAADYEEANMDELLELPETGTLLLTSDVDIDSDVVEDISPAIMLDVGLPKEGLTDKLNALQLETNVPYIFIDISFGKLPQAYRSIGRLLGCEQRAEALAEYVESVMDEVGSMVPKQQGAPKVFYAQRECGLELTSGVSLQLDALFFAGAIPIVEPYDFASKTINFETLSQTPVSWIIFDDTTMLESLQNGEGKAWDIWSNVISMGTSYAVSPALYHSWFGSLVFAQSIGLLWLCSMFWPQLCNWTIEERAQEFYDLFYGRDLEEESTQELVGEFQATMTPDAPILEPIDADNEEVISDEQ